MAKTTIVVGAGASCGFGLPTGPQLNGLIAEMVSTRVNEWGETIWTDDHFNRSFRKWPGISGQELSQASQLIAKGIRLHPSPDDFLYAFGENESVIVAGKAAIAAAILKQEGRGWLAKLLDHEPEKSDKLLADHAECWPLQLIRLLSPGLRRSEASSLFREISFVNFNYDRCLEHIFYHALQRSHGVSTEEAAAIVSDIEIIHPYGRVAPLPWQSSIGAVPYGGSHAGHLEALATSIHTLTEAHHTEEERDQIGRTMTASARVVFLGFGFHRQNMDLIRANPHVTQGWRARTFATAMGTSHSQREVFSHRMSEALQLGARTPTLVDRDCEGFFNDFGLEAFSK